jgi:RHS repeat-associated protein
MNKRIVSLIAVILSFTLGIAPGLSFAYSPADKGKSGDPLPTAKRPSPLPVPKPAPALPRRQGLPPGQSVTLLPDGRELLLGGESPDGPRGEAAVANSRAEKPVPLTARLRHARAWHSATVLPDGRVFIFGGVGGDGQVLGVAEVFDPATQKFTDLQVDGLTPRAGHTATLLTDGRVILIGGVGADGNLSGEAQLWEPLTGKVSGAAAGLSTSRQRHTATLTADGQVLVWGGTQKADAELTSGELYNAESQVFTWWGTPPEQMEAGLTPYLAGALPQQGAIDVPVETAIALRFSRLLDVGTVNARTVALAGPEGAVAARVVAAEDGRLAFVTPSVPLRPATAYSVTVDGVKDREGAAASTTTLNFTTAADGEKQSPATHPTDDEQWMPSSRNLRGDWTSRRQKSEWQDQPSLQAGPGVTALAGQVFLINGRPLPDVTVRLQGKTAQTDQSGRFLLSSLEAGHHVMTVDGRSAARGNKAYGLFKIGVDIIAGKTNVLPFTSWMPRLDTDNATTITSPTASEVVLKTPYIPRLEVHIPAGAVVRDTDGQTVTRLSITPIPVDRPPFPLPPEVKVPVFFTVQPGASRVIPPRARVIYPNYNSDRPGTRINFWNYDPENKGWYVYGQGTVTPDGRQVVPDPGVVIYEFTGFMIASPSLAPSTGPRPGDQDGDDGDPVNLGTGLFVHRHTDMALVDTMPIALTRTYRQNDLTPRAFGIGASHPYEMFLVGTTFPYTYQDLILADGGRVHFDRISPGTSYSDAVYESLSPTAFYKARLTWNGGGWNIKLKNGSMLVFPDGFNAGRASQSAVIRIQDRNGNTINIARGSNGNITRITSPNGRFIDLTYDASDRVTQARDNVGRTVNYTYDAGGRLWKVTDLAGGVTEYTYNTSHQMLTLKDAKGVIFLTNEYDAAGKVTKQYQADNTTYLFAYTLAADGKVTQTDITGPRGQVRRVTFNADGYILTDTRSSGTTEQQTITYERQAGSDLPLSVTDALGRKTAYTYDAMGNVAALTRQAGTANAVTTTFTYEPTFNYPASVTDPLNHTTSYEYDAKGNITGASDPLGHRTSFTYNTTGQLTSVGDALGNTAQFRYEMGDLVEVVNARGDSTSQFIDDAGRLLSLTTPQGQVIRYEYDAANRPVKVTDPLGGITTFSYDANGNLLSLKDARNNTTSYTYNSMNRMVGRTDALLRAESYAYDATGNLTKYTDRRGKVTTFTYDNLNRRTFAGFGTVVGATSTTYESTINYTYDAGQRLTKTVDSAYGTSNFTYDGLDRLLSKATPQGTISYTYDAVSRPASMTVTGQPAVNYTFDDDGRLTHITQGTSNVSLTYDAADRRTSLTLPNGLSVEYAYDSKSNLTGLTYKNGAAVLGDISYERDSLGNRTKVGGSFARLAPAQSAALTYDAANQLKQKGSAALAYDANGNLTGDGVNTYTWDARNQLASISGGVTASFGYDGSGRRTKKTVNGSITEYLYDGFNAVQELSGGSVTANLLSGGLDEVFARTTASGTQTPLVDGLGSTLALTNASGNIQTEYAYDAFGNTTATGAASSYPYQYAGRENDGTGLYYNRARYYTPGLQRFISQDPISFAGGINHYAYARNNPTNLVDPLGMDGGNPFLDGLQLALDVGGMIPGLGEPLDLVNAGISALRGDYIGAALSMAAAVPLAGELAGAAKIARRTHTADQVALKELVDEATNIGRKPLSVDDANTVLDWAHEVQYPGVRAGAGDVSSPSNWNGGGNVPHIHVPGAGRNGHVPVEPGVAPRP